jgi:hypothetical protein
MLERFPESLPRTKSLGRKGKQAPPFAACNAREVWDREAKWAKVNDFKKGIGAQIKTQQRQKRQLMQLKQQETEQVRAASEMLLRTQQNESKLRKQQAQQYRRALDAQSGVTAQHTFQTNLSRFYGYDSSTQDYTEAAGRFFGSGDAEASGSPSRFLKTLPRSTLIDPITGLVRIYPIHRQRLQSLGRAKPVQVTAKISDSPPPRSVYHEQPRFEKNIPRRMIFNPLTGERKLLEDKSMPVFSHSFEYRKPPYSLLQRSPYVPKQAL